jgi:hypothetical protein
MRRIVTLAVLAITVGALIALADIPRHIAGAFWALALLIERVGI